MKSSDFNELFAKIKFELVGKDHRFYSRGLHYVFHDAEKCVGMACVFTSSNVNVSTFTLEDLIEDNKGTRYLNSKVLKSGYFLLTHLQKNKLVILLDQHSKGVF